MAVTFTIIVVFMITASILSARKSTAGASAVALDEIRIAASYIEKEESDLAAQHFLKALRYDSRQWGAWRGLGLCYADSGNYGAAVRMYSESLLLNPKCEECRREMSGFIRKARDVKKIKKNNTEVF